MKDVTITKWIASTIIIMATLLTLLLLSLAIIDNNKHRTHIVVVREVTQTPVITPTVNPVPTPIRIYLIDSFEQKDWCFERDGLIERGKTDNGMLICRLPNPLPDIEKYKKTKVN